MTWVVSVLLSALPALSGFLATLSPSLLYLAGLTSLRCAASRLLCFFSDLFYASFCSLLCLHVRGRTLPGPACRRCIRSAIGSTRTEIRAALALIPEDRSRSNPSRPDPKKCSPFHDPGAPASLEEFNDMGASTSQCHHSLSRACTFLRCFDRLPDCEKALPQVVQT